jgi:RNA polymerase sigma-70 factor (ECF subfamily)
LAFLSNNQNLRLVRDYTSFNDNELVEMARAGDKPAFSALVVRHERTVAATVIGMLGAGDDAEDVGQSVFIRFYKALNDFRGEAALSTYLTRIAINLSLNEIKRRQRRNLFFYRPISTETDFNLKDSTNWEEASDTKEIVNKALQTLETKFRSVVVLRLMQGYSTEETAKILKLPPGTVLSRLSRAQEKLKKILKQIID